MTKFGHLKEYNPEGRCVRYALPIAGTRNKKGEEIPAVLEIVHAGRSNRSYTAAVMRINAKQGPNVRIGTQATVTDVATALKENLRIDRELFPQHIIKRWEGIGDEDGRAVKFSVAACAEFLDALPDWIVHELSVFCARPRNFLPDSMPTEIEIEEQAGN